MNNSPKSSTSWVDGYPCALVYECLKSTGFIPSGIKTLIITSAYDAMVFSFGATGSDGEGHHLYTIYYFPLSSTTNIVNLSIGVSYGTNA